MPTIQYSFEQDYNPADSTTASLHIYDPNDQVKAFFRAVAGGTDALFYQDIDTGEQHFVSDSRGTSNVVTSAQFGLNIDYHDNIADCTLSGGEHGDLITGGHGNDYILGGAGADKMAGNAGDDTMTSDGGDDRMIGGGGSDTFLFNFNGGAADRIATIVGLNAGDDINLFQASFNFGGPNFKAVDQFDHTAGEVVAAYKAGTDRTVFKFDFDNDGKVDHKIVVLGGDFTDYSHVSGVDLSGLSTAVAPDHGLVV